MPTWSGTLHEIINLAAPPFSLGIKNATGGAGSANEFSVTKHIKGVKLRACATGELTTTSLSLEANLKKKGIATENVASSGKKNYLEEVQSWLGTKVSHPF